MVFILIQVTNFSLMVFILGSVLAITIIQYHKYCLLPSSSTINCSRAKPGSNITHFMAVSYNHKDQTSTFL